VSTKYGIKTLAVLFSFLLQRLGLMRPKIFNLTLAEVVSRHYHDSIFKESPSR
jgi:hypothetical protein